MPRIAPVPAPGEVVVGVDTHKDFHVAVALDALGVHLGVLRLPASAAGTADLLRWACGFGRVAAFGVEGTGSYGVELMRGLSRAGALVVEVSRPDRRARRLLGGKSDPIDAEAAARSVLTGRYALAIPKARTGNVELLRVTRAVRASAVKARTAAMNQLKGLLITAPAPLRAELEPLAIAALIQRCCRFRRGGEGVVSHTKGALRALACRWRELDREVKAHSAELERLVQRCAPALLAEHGVGPVTAATLLITVGDNPHRLHSEAALAALCGTSPIPASSGKTDRHRLNRGGDRSANCALHQIVVVRLASHAETRRYMGSHVNGNDSNKLHVMRQLKRYLVRRLYPLLLAASTSLNEEDETLADIA